MFSTTVTQKGQITIPKAFRDALGIASYDRIFFEQGNDHIKITKSKSILSLAGIFKSRKNKNALKARQYMEKNYSR